MNPPGPDGGTPPLAEVFIVQHSHTDLGFTHDAPVVWELHRRFLDRALDLIERDDDGDAAPGERFAWTVEVFAPLLRWLETASSRQVARLQAAERAGRIEVAALPLHFTPLYDPDQMAGSLAPLRRLREDYGLRIAHAMSCDVNGQNWPLADVLLDHGVAGYSTAINTHFGRAPLPRPQVFRWEAPTGRHLAAYVGMPYGFPAKLGIDPGAGEQFAERWLPRLEAHLRAAGYPLPSVLLQSVHPFGDNAPPYPEILRFIRAWNAAGRRPRLRLGTPGEWWRETAAYRDRLPVRRGDWTDAWNFGAGAAAREAAILRAARARLRNAETLRALPLDADPEPGDDDPAGRLFAAAWEAVGLYTEHTFNADCALEAPHCEDSWTQTAHKSAYAAQARSLSLLLQRDGLAALARRVRRENPDDLVLVNLLPWAREISGPVSPGISVPRGVADDDLAGRHTQDRKTDLDHLAGYEPSLSAPAQYPRDYLPPTAVPAFGYVTVPRTRLRPLAPREDERDADRVETDRFRVVVDRERGGVASFFDKALDHEWVRPDAPHPFGGYVHERRAEEAGGLARRSLFVMDWEHDGIEIPAGWQGTGGFVRRGPTRLRASRAWSSAAGVTLLQELDAPGCVGPLRQSIFLPAGGERVELRSGWVQGLEARPEAAYIVFPFQMENATVRLDLGGQAMVPGADQLPGTCCDYYTVQNWVDFNDGARGVTVATPDNPLVQLGGFHFGANRPVFSLDSATLLGWVTNNYWDVNFRPWQPGAVFSRYVLYPYRGAFQEAAAHRRGREAREHLPLLHKQEPPAPATLPGSGSLLRLPEFDPACPVQTLAVKKGRAPHTLELRLQNASDAPALARVGPGLLALRGVERTDPAGRPGKCALADGEARLMLGPRATAHLLVRTDPLRPPGPP